MNGETYKSARVLNSVTSLTRPALLIRISTLPPVTFETSVAAFCFSVLAVVIPNT